MWLAFKMSGFGGLVVPEKGYHEDGMFKVPLNYDSNTIMCRCVPEDGVVFDTYEECVEHCDRMNRHRK
jgi:hypothetical protein